MDVVLFTDVNGWYGLARYAGTYRVATELRKAGYSCQVVDYFTCFDLQRMQSIVKKFVTAETLFVGFSTTLLASESVSSESFDTEDLNAQCGQYYSCRLLPEDKYAAGELFAAIRAANPKVKIVAGGTKVIYGPSHPGVDYWVSGQADLSVLALANYLSGEDSALVKTENPNGSFTIYSKRDYPYQDFRSSQMTFTARDLIDENESLPIEISRGCAFNCSFCTFEKRENSLDYVKLPEVLRSELIQNYENFGVTRYMLCDDTYNDSLEKVQMLARLARELPFKMEFTTYCRLDMLHAKPQMMPLILEAGARSVFFGIETLDAKAGGLVGKGLGKERIFSTLAKIKAEWGSDVFTAGSFILGLPGETESSLLETIQWVHEERPFGSWFWNLLMVRNRERLKPHGVSSSAMALEPEKYGFFDIVDNFESWRHQTLSFERAKTLQARARADERNRTGNHLWSGHGWLNMMWNLGYSNAECAQMTLDNIRSFDCLTRKSQKVEKYFARLMNLEPNDQGI